MKVYYPTYRNRYLPAFTLDEISALDEKEKIPVILPIGAIEQHGPHMPVGVDSIIAQARLDYVMPLFPDHLKCLVAPPIQVGKSNEHTGFPGTLIIPKDVLRNQILTIATQLKLWGFKILLILNTHGGNSQVIRYTLREIQDELNMHALALHFDHGINDISQQETTYGFHAGEGETSIMLDILNDELIDMPKAVCEFPARIEDPGKLRPEGAPAIFSWVTADLSSSGIMGDATVATREKGARWMESSTQGLLEILTKICSDFQT